jgi:outer membrane protein TolC
MNAASALLVLWMSATSAAPPVLTLDAALQEARERNLDLKAAQARLAQADELSARVWAAYLPQVSAGAAYTYNQPSATMTLPTGYFIRQMTDAQGNPDTSQGGPAFDPAQPMSPANPPGLPSSYVLYPSGMQDVTIVKQHQLGGQLQVTQGLVLPALWPAFRNAELARDVAGTGVEVARREVLFAVAQLYYGAVALKEVEAVQQRLLENSRAHEADAEVRVKAGTAPQIFVIRAQIDRTRIEQDLQRARNAFASARVALGTLLDHPEEFDVEHPPEPQAPYGTPDELAGAALRDRPDVRLADRGLALAHGGHDAVLYKYAPNLALSGLYRVANMKGFSDSYDAWAVTLGLNWSLWDGGARESERREGAARVVEAQATLQSAQHKARDEVRRAVLDLESARANRLKAEEQARLARENMRLVSVAYSSGTATQVDLSDATTALAAAEVGAVTEALNVQVATLRLQKAVGAFGR